MKFIISSILAGLLTVFSIPSMALAVGDAGPAFDLPGTTGTVNLAGLKGKVVYVDFWASWCGPCKQSFPWLNEMQAKYGAKGFQIVGISVDTKMADAKTFLTEVPAKFTVAFDEKSLTPKLYGIKGMPSSVLLDGNSKVIMQHTGFKDSEKAQLEQAIAQALSAK